MVTVLLGLTPPAEALQFLEPVSMSQMRPPSLTIRKRSPSGDMS
jgi:hypothetical protein